MARYATSYGHIIICNLIRNCFFLNSQDSNKMSNITSIGFCNESLSHNSRRKNHRKRFWCTRFAHSRELNSSFGLISNSWLLIPKECYNTMLYCMNVDGYVIVMRLIFSSNLKKNKLFLYFAFLRICDR